MSKTRIFGPIEPNALSNLASFFERVRVPVGYPCVFCGVFFEESDPGVILPRGHAAHKKCFLQNGIEMVMAEKSAKVLVEESE
jgi:hypothetical protein